MKKNRTKQRNVILTVFPLVLCSFFLCIAWVWGNREDWVRFKLFLVAAIIVGMWFPACLIRQKLDERFDRLEKFLSDKVKKDSN